MARVSSPFTSWTLALLLIGAAHPAMAQTLGLRGGLTLTNVNVSEPGRLPVELQWCCSPWDGTRWEGTLGLSGGTTIKPGFEISAELLFTRRGFVVDAQQRTPAASLRLSYLEMPLLAHVVGDWVHLSAGPLWAVRTSASQRTTRTSDGTYLAESTLADVDLGVVLGAGLHKGRWSVDGRFVQGFRNVLRAAPAGAALKNKSLMLLAGFRLAGPEPSPLPREPQRR